MPSESVMMRQTSARPAPETMRAAVITEKNSLQSRIVGVPVLKPGEALIRVEYCGICGSDIHVLHGQHPTARFPVVPGHEFVGELVAVKGGGGDGFTLGDTVVAQPFFSCGNCQPCAKGRDNVCRQLRFMGAHTDGAFAQYVKVATRKMYALPAHVDHRLAALVEPIAVAVHDVRRSGLQVGETALVIGGGAIGLLVALVARRAGAGMVIISEPNEYRRRVAEELGFRTVDPTDGSLDEALDEASGDLGFDVVFEASGSRAGVAATTRYAKITGKIMIIGMTREPYPVDLSAVFAKELIVEGVRIHAQYNFIGAVELLKEGSLNAEFAKLVTNVFPFDQIGEAFTFAQSGGDSMKILVRL
ncbi:MAG: alcohol dehydrogenase catalytic domain-containing protein [Planctomycetes bacterium]|nr:alcohol dehydrogenase catalytic domain-containing protein [Planctomycetota bacterium]